MALFRDRRQRVHDRAGKWLVRMRARPSLHEKRRFLAWYDSDPAHAEAYDDQARFWDASADVDLTSPLADPVESRPPIFGTGERYALAAVLVAGIAVAALLLASGRIRPGAPAGREMMMLSTLVGEVRQVPIGEGARLILDSDSALRIGPGPNGQRIKLERGRARIEALGATLPIILNAGAAEIEAAGAIFDVRLEFGAAIVTSLGGDVAVRSAMASDPRRTKLSARQTLIASPTGVRLRAGGDWSRNWPSGMLEFDSAPLDSVIAEANRYSRRKLRLAQGVGHLKVTGAFKAGDILGLALSLAEAFSLELVDGSSGDLLLRPKSRNKFGG